MEKINKRCPRCETKMPISVSVCSSCGLNYTKFNSATNKAGKVALKEGRKEDVIFRKGCPTDVNKTKLLLLAIFLGFTGAHNYYVGRLGKGLFYSIFFLVGIANAVLTVVFKAVFTGWVYEVVTILVLIWGLVILMWMFDIINIIFNKYKIPVSVEL